MKRHLLPTGSEERKVLGIESMPVALCTGGSRDHEVNHATLK